MFLSAVFECCLTLAVLMAGVHRAEPLGCFDELVPSGDNVYPLNKADGKRVVSLGEKESWSLCQTACAMQTTPVCHSWTYFFANASNYHIDAAGNSIFTGHAGHDHTVIDKEDALPKKTCFIRTDNYWNPEFQFGNGMVSGVNCKSPPSTSLPNPPAPNVQFSWEHVPVFIHTSNVTGPYNDESLAVMAKFPLVTIEKYQGPHSGVHYPAEQWQCCEEDRIVAALQAVKKINPNITGIFYYNMILDFPQYRLHENFAKNESWWLHNDEGKVLRVPGDGHSHPDLLVYDTTQEAVGDLFMHACLDLIPSGAVDGCFVDRTIDGIPSADINLERQEDMLLSHITTLQKFQQLIGRGPLIGNHGYSIPGVNAVMIEGFRPDEQSIHQLQWCAARGKLTEAHMAGGDCNSDEGIQDHLAAFLIGAGNYSYFGCGPWYSDSVNITSQWKESYDKPLGMPMGAAVREGTVYTRKFASGTEVQFDVSHGKGVINWGHAAEGVAATS